jgi:membrane peptidoglycan carboxypeptidase
MSAQNPPRRGVLAAVLGTAAFSVIAGILVTAMVTPAIAVSSVAVQSGVGIFNDLPTYITVGKLPGQNTMWANSGGKQVKIATIYDENRNEVPWDEVADAAKNAAVDGEDRRFYQHGGVDPTGVVRALAVSAFGGSRQGASTITQQLVKNLLIQKALQITVTPKGKMTAVQAAAKQAAEQKAAIRSANAPSLDRKLKEMKLAISLEKKYTKKQILLEYLNLAPFGGTTYGIEAAAERYYSTTAAKLTIAQAASLMAIVQEPATRAPLNAAGYAANTQRRNVILQAMLGAGDITTAQYDEAKKTPVDATTVKLALPNNGCTAAYATARYFCAYINSKAMIGQLTALGATPAERKANWALGGYEIHTTLDLGLQNTAQATMSKWVPKSLPNFPLGGATDSVEVGTGRILVMAQNTDFIETKAAASRSATAVNYSVDGKYGGSTYGFQGGSTYKAFTLMNWLQSGHGLNESVNATPRLQNQADFKDSCNPSGHETGAAYPYRNDEGEGGQWTVMRGTARSVNGAFISMGKQLDQCTTQKIAIAFGVHTGESKPPLHNTSAILGTNAVAPLTMAAAYAGIAGSGNYCQPIAVDYVISPSNKKLPGQPQSCTQAISAGVAVAAGVALQGVFNPGGTASAAKPHDKIPILGKTGTTDRSAQTWTVGSSTKVATAVWIGDYLDNLSSTRRTRSGVRGCVDGYVATLRNCVFRDTQAAINAQYGGGAFPTAQALYLRGTAKPLPNYAGQSINSATAQLTALGFSVTVGSPIASAQPEGTVASTDPGAGTLVSKGASITLNPSDGSLATTVPDVVGEPYDQAKDDLAKANLTAVPDATCTPSPGEGSGGDGNGGDSSDGPIKVTATNPTARTSVAKGSKVTVTCGP